MKRSIEVGLSVPSGGAAFARGTSKQDYSTPADFMASVEARFGGFCFDLAASWENRKAEHFFTEEKDALGWDWSEVSRKYRDWTRRWLWLNPPFKHIAPWAEKCRLESERGAEILFLVPAGVGANWWKRSVHNRAAVLFLNGRLSFDGKNPYPKDCALCVYSRREITGYECWNWKESV